MSQPTILVTGATGNIGRALVQRLMSAGATVIAGSPSGESVAGASGRVVKFEDPASLRQAFDGVDRLFLLLPLVPGKIDLARNAANAAKAACVRFVLRSCGAGADPDSPMAWPVCKAKSTGSSWTPASITPSCARTASCRTSSTTAAA